jgi:hypothetical protein
MLCGGSVYQRNILVVGVTWPLDLDDLTPVSILEILVGFWGQTLICD